MKQIDLYKLQRYVAFTILGFLVVFLALELFFSLHWRMEHDTPILHYIAFMIDRHGFVPYRDIYEQSMPGIYLFHLAIGKTLGYGDRAFQVVNIAYTLMTIAATWMLLKPFGKVAALTSPIFFSLIYMSFGPLIILQRDYVGILPIILALIVVTRDDLIANRHIRMLVAGLAIGIAISIKPQLGICLPIMILYEASKQPFMFKSLASTVLQAGITSATGIIIVCSIPILWLWRIGGLSYFWDIFTNYLPLYLHVSGDHIVHVGAERWIYTLQNYIKFGGIAPLFFCACFGAYYVFFVEHRPQQKRLGILLITLSLAYNIYPIISGKFWEYHWMPFYYFASLWTGILLSPNLIVSPQKITKEFIFLLFFLVLGFTAIRPTNNFILQLKGQPPEPLIRADNVTDILNLRLQPGDTVQPLDVVLGDVVQGMLVADAQIATPFIYDYQFYHDVSNPYIQNLRKEFVQKLNESKPRFIVEYVNRPIPTGFDTSSVFPELEQFIQQGYKIIYEKNKIRIYLRK